MQGSKKQCEWLCMQGAPSQDDVMMKSFMAFDRDGSGFISRAEVQSHLILSLPESHVHTLDGIQVVLWINNL